MTTILFSNCMADSRENIRAFVEKACHLGDSLAGMAEAAKIISVYVVSESTTLVEAKATVERAAQDLSPPCNPPDLALHVKTFGKQEFTLTTPQTPSARSTRPGRRGGRDAYRRHELLAGRP